MPGEENPLNGRLNSGYARAGLSAAPQYTCPMYPFPRTWIT
jgi:hypothetical protein